jgi:hypothetical protein
METIWVICPLGRKNMDNVWKNFTHQTYYNKKLIVVENGDGLGECVRLGLMPDVLASCSECKPSVAKNVGIDEIKKKGGGFWTTFDDDDYYGPNYLSELSENINKANVIGKYWNFIYLSSGLYLFSWEKANKECKYVQGPTISSRTEECVYFNPESKIGEDFKFCEDMENKGAKLYNTSIYNFCYNRKGNNHTWRAMDVQIRKNFGISQYFGKVPVSIVDSLERFIGPIFIQEPSDEEIFAALRELPLS